MTVSIGGTSSVRVPDTRNVLYGMPTHAASVPPFMSETSMARPQQRPQSVTSLPVLVCPSTTENSHPSNDVSPSLPQLLTQPASGTQNPFSQACLRMVA